MKRIALIFLLLLVAACTKINTGNICTMDAKVCPDGSSVGRDPNNNCEFYDCPVRGSGDKPIPVEPDGGIGITDPYTKYASINTEECKTILFQCIEGSSEFSDYTGCGCRADEPKKYVSNNTDECSVIRYMCIKNYVPFSDENGCGCEFSFGQDQGKLQAIECTPEQRNAEVCTLEYAPVCGWFDQSIQCFRYPCAQTYSNSCEACINDKVAYYTAGECPNGDEILR